MNVKGDRSGQLSVLQSWVQAKVRQKAGFNEGWGFTETKQQNERGVRGLKVYVRKL